MIAEGANLESKVSFGWNGKDDSIPNRTEAGRRIGMVAAIDCIPHLCTYGCIFDQKVCRVVAKHRRGGSHKLESGIVNGAILSAALETDCFDSKIGRWRYDRRRHLVCRHPVPVRGRG